MASKSQPTLSGLPKQTTSDSAHEAAKVMTESETASAPAQATASTADNVLCKTQQNATGSVQAQDGTNSGPLCLPPEVVDKILECLDDSCLLTARLVCKFWNKQIADRNALWKERCQRKQEMFHDFDFTSMDTCFMDEYLRYHRAHHHLQTGEAFQVTRHAKPLQCFPHCKENLKNLEDTFFMEKLRGSTKVYVHSSYKLVGLTPERSVLAVDLRSQQVLWEWRHNFLTFACCDYNSPYVYAVTYHGTLLLISWDKGVCERRIDCGEKLLGAQLEVSFYRPSYRFLLVEVYAHQEGGLMRLCLVDLDKGRVSELDLPYPDLDRATEHMAFLPDDSLSEGQLAVCVLRDNVVMAAVVDSAQGTIVHQAYRTIEQSRTTGYSAWFHGLNPHGHFVTVEDDTVKKYSVRCKSSGVHFDLQWTWPFFTESYGGCQSLRFGDRFVLGANNKGRSLRIFRLDTGREVFHLPNVFPELPFFCSRSSHSQDKEQLALETLSLSVEKVLEKLKKEDDEIMERINRQFYEEIKQIVWIDDKMADLAEAEWAGAGYKSEVGDFVRREEARVFFSNLRWLNGLTPASTSLPDVPIVTVIDVTRARDDEEDQFWCLRWSDNLWASLSGGGDDDDDH